MTRVPWRAHGSLASVLNYSKKTIKKFWHETLLHNQQFSKKYRRVFCGGTDRRRGVMRPAAIFTYVNRRGSLKLIFLPRDEFVYILEFYGAIITSFLFFSALLYVNPIIYVSVSCQRWCNESETRGAQNT